MSSGTCHGKGLSSAILAVPVITICGCRYAEGSDLSKTFTVMEESEGEEGYRDKHQAACIEVCKQLFEVCSLLPLSLDL